MTYFVSILTGLSLGVALGYLIARLQYRRRWKRPEGFAESLSIEMTPTEWERVEGTLIFKGGVVSGMSVVKEDQ